MTWDILAAESHVESGIRARIRARQVTTQSAARHAHSVSRPYGVSSRPYGLLSQPYRQVLRCLPCVGGRIHSPYAAARFATVCRSPSPGRAHDRAGSIGPHLSLTVPRPAAVSSPPECLESLPVLWSDLVRVHPGRPAALLTRTATGWDEELRARTAGVRLPRPERSESSFRTDPSLCPIMLRLRYR